MKIRLWACSGYEHQNDLGNFPGAEKVADVQYCVKYSFQHCLDSSCGILPEIRSNLGASFMSISFTMTCYSSHVRVNQCLTAR